VGLLVTLTCLMPAPAPAQFLQNTQTPAPPPNGNRIQSAIPGDSRISRNDVPEPLSARQKLSIMHANFEKSKSDAAELAALAKALHEELNKPNVNPLSLEVMSRAEKIEKLARKIRDETKGY
jgi:hypothetical protein